MTADEIFEEAALNWRDNKGVGTALIPPPLEDKVLLYKILSKCYAKNSLIQTIIVVENINLRMDVIEFLTHQDSEENNQEFKKLIDSKKIRVLTKKFVLESYYKFPPTLCIYYKATDYNSSFDNWFTSCLYRLVIINNLLSKDNNTGDVFKKQPLLDCFRQTEIDALRVSSPVEETWIDVEIPKDSESWKLYQYYSKYIETSLNIFGSFDIMQQARLGNETLNISAASICEQLAQENGWNEHLDMSYEFNLKIDELYNPNNLRSRATNTYDIIRKRTQLLSDYDGKLEKILEIVKDNVGHKILIINKRGEFASKVTDYLNSNSETDICGNYHNKADDIPAVDIEGNPIYFKSGVEKGKRKSMGFKAQMTLNEKKFNLGKLYCLSLSNSPDKSLNVDFDTIIITSPICEDVKSYMYRLSNINLTTDKIKLFSIFCKDTLEQQKLMSKPITDLHTIVNKDKIMAEIENNIDFLIVD